MMWLKVVTSFVLIMQGIVKETHSCANQRGCKWTAVSGSFGKPSKGGWNYSLAKIWVRGNSAWLSQWWP